MTGFAQSAHVALTVYVYLLALDAHRLAQAKTGTGKTLAFLIPTLQRIGQPPKDGCMSILILAPTRELATQIMEEGENLAKSLPFHFDCFTGGKPEGGQQKRLSARTINVLVAVSRLQLPRIIA